MRVRWTPALLRWRVAYTVWGWWYDSKRWLTAAEPGAQSRLGSIIEAVANVMVGYSIALAAQLVILPAYGAELSLRSNLEIGLWFTVVSLCRSYLLRRWFNARSRR